MATSRSTSHYDRCWTTRGKRLLEIIGEAATRVSDEERSRLPGIPWAQITGKRNRFIHGYDFVELDILWQTVTVDLPPLIGELERILSTES